MASGSTWTDPKTGEEQQKLHLHWRLSEPTRSRDDYDKLRKVRWLAARIANADLTAAAPCDPLRWPGSWNVKNAPKLAQIISLNEAMELHLEDALGLLEAATNTQGSSMAAVAVERERKNSML